MLPVIAAAALAITLNGRPISPPPHALVIDGAAYLPVREMAQVLGAGVTYEQQRHLITLAIDRRDGTFFSILHVGTAQRRSAPSAPVIHGHLYLPLRLVAIALHVRVDYSAAKRTIAISTPQFIARTAGPVPAVPSYAHPASATMHAALVTPKFPQPGASIPDAYPAISALVAPQGGSTVDPNAIRLYVDNNDVSANATVIGDQIVYTPHTPLANGVHSVHVDGVDRDGVPFTGDWSFTSSYSPPSVSASPSTVALNSVYLDRAIGAGDRYFNVIAYGPPGGYGYVTVDGVPGIYNFNPQGVGRYVAQVTLPLGIDQPFAHAYVHYTSAGGQVMNYTLPTTFQVYTLYPANSILAPAAATPTPTPFPLDPGMPRRGVIRATPTPEASRVPLTTTDASPTPSPIPTATPLTHKRHILSTPRPMPTLSPKPVATPSNP